MKRPRFFSALAALLASSLLNTAAFAGVSMTRTSSPVFYTDLGNSPALNSMYVSYPITNTGGTNYASVYVTASNFTGGVVSLATNENGLINLGPLAPGQTKTAFFYLTASSLTAAAQTHTITVRDAPPGIGSTLLTQNFSFTSVADTISANANKVTTTVYGPDPPAIGGIVTVTVMGHTGTIGSGLVGSFTPASFASWRADAYQLISTTITLSGGNTGVYNDILLLPPAAFASTSDTDYTSVFRFRAVGTTAASTPVSPVGYISSGAQTKHTTTSNFASLSPLSPAQNSTVLAKTVTPNSLLASGTVTYTVRLTNSGAIDTSYDRIVDLLPATPANATYVPGSSTFNGVAMVNPNLNGQTATWFGTFDIPAGTSRDLVYQVTIPAAGGDYVNSAKAFIENTQIDTTANTSDNAPAIATVTLTALALSGTVFEDVNYGGGSGRSLLAASGVPRPGARVELYDGSGNFVSFTTTDASGNYTFNNVSPGAQTVRVVNTTVTSSRTGYVGSLLRVQTFRTDGSTGAAVAVTDRVGGEIPALTDAGNGSTTLAALTTATTTPQSITAVTVGAASVPGLDFGFNFDTIVNTKDTGQGSFRQFIINANTLGNAGLAQAGQTTGKEASIFMISDGAAHPGLRAGLPNLLTGGVVVITPTSALPALTASDTIIDGTTQTTNVGNTNPAVLGTGGTVGVDNLPLATLAGPEVEIRDGSSLAFGFNLQSANITIRGLAMNGFGNSPNNNGHGEILLNSSATGALIEENVLGTSATSFTDPGAGPRSGGDHIRSVGTA
ncbi:MAG TPA: carboxypeptidase regulatory-like domain-containing protein, partial [Chthoniobacterales bacterium]|nr:carboxypeptidase regulatory-like domain-containing protein [Chthoniobacterales bacterium]